MLNELDSKLLGGILLVAGTTIGAGMLVMPITTGLFGFLGTLCILFGCWLFMYWTATLILEATLYFGHEASFITMSKKTLGVIGSSVTWIAFLLFFYALIAAYLSGGGSILLDAITGFSNEDFPLWIKIFPLLALLSPFIYFGLSVVDHLNRYLMLAMSLLYVMIIFLLFPNMEPSKLSYTNWSFSLLSFSVVVTSFGFHSTIPTLVNYLERDVKRIKKCLLLGSLIPLVVYVIWELSILSIVPVEGPFGIADAFSNEIALSYILNRHNDNNFLIVLIRIFSLFAIITSFLGVAQGLFDFLKDGLKAKNHKMKLIAFILTFLPPVVFLLFFENGFIRLLEYAGALVAVILGIIPILVVYKLRIHNKNKLHYQAVGNKFALILGLLFFSFVIIFVILKNSGLITFSTSGLL